MYLKVGKFENLLTALIVLSFSSVSFLASASADSADSDSESPISLTATPRKVSTIDCAHYKVYYIDPSAQFFTAPSPIEDHAEFVFCSDHPNLDEVHAKLKKMGPIRSHADASAGRIKVVPTNKPEEAFTFCSTGEITYGGKQFRPDRRIYEPSLLALREEGDRQRALAVERENEREPRNPASKGR